MKLVSWLWAMALLLSPFCLNSCVAAGEALSISHQEITVVLTPETHLLNGESTVSITAAGTRVSFTLSPGATVDHVSLNGNDTLFQFSSGVLTVGLPHESKKRADRLTIRYHRQYNDPVPEQVTTTEEPTYGISGVISSQGIFLGSDAGWYPEPAVIPAKRTITVSAPVGFEAITAGKRLLRKTEQRVTTSSWEIQTPIKNLPLSAGPYRITEKKVGTLTIYTYFYPDNYNLADRYLDAAAKYIQFYEKLLGPYPFEKFAVVENFFPTGYGFPSYTLLGSAIIRLPFIVGTSLPHEIAHSWWGNGVLVDYGGGNWSEGLVTYLADYLLEEKKSVQAGRDYRLKILADYASLVPPEKEFPLREFTGRVDPASRSIGYGKGAMVFHMVRAMIGDASFFQALRDVCREKLFKTASWSDFTRAFSKAAGRDLTPFMNQWLARAGGPQLALSDVSRRNDGKNWLVSGTVRQSSPYYALSLNLRLETEGEEYLQTVAVDGGRTPFRFSVRETPKRILLDPDADFFRILSIREIPPAVNRIKGSEKLLVAIAKGCRAQDESLRMLLESLGQQKATIVHEEEVDSGGIASHDLLMCGIPARKDLFPQLPAGVSITPQGFTIDHESFEKPDDALFIVTNSPAGPGRVVSLFLPLSPTAAAKSALKITHYGKYGYLVFSAGENRKKGTFPPEGGAGVVTF